MTILQCFMLMSLAINLVWMFILLRRYLRYKASGSHFTSFSFNSIPIELKETTVKVSGNATYCWHGHEENRELVDPVIIKAIKSVISTFDGNEIVTTVKLRPKLNALILFEAQNELQRVDVNIYRVNVSAIEF